MTQPPPKNNPKQEKSSHSFFVSLLSGILVFALLGGIFEGTCRAGWLNSALPMRSVGNYHTQFETKLFKLDDYVRQHGGVDVILLGNSMVNTGIDPSIVAARYQQLTGKELRIFNFGVEGLTVAPLSSLAQILVERYHPGTIILFTEMRDYIAGNGDDVATNFLGNAWIQQQLGHSSIEGFIETHSYAMQHILPFRYWARADFMDTYILDARRLAETTTQGYEADRQTGTDITRMPDPSDPTDAKTFALFENYTMDSARIAALQQILAFDSQGTMVVVTEMPVYPTYYAYIENDSVRTNYLAELQGIVQTGKGVYLSAVDYNLIPLTGRVDNHHLNYQGAPLYSSLLAQQLAELCSSQSACLNPSAQGARP